MNLDWNSTALKKEPPSFRAILTLLALKVVSLCVSQRMFDYGFG